MELALSLLEQQYNNQGLKWETRYCLLLWLSIIVMIPFDMSRLDGANVKETTAFRYSSIDNYLFTFDDFHVLSMVFQDSELLQKGLDDY